MGEGVIAGARKVLEEAAVEPGAVATVIHGTTPFANALIERRAALITSKGFRDAIEIGREHRYDMYDL
jgi:N-methylhydantoinase A